MAGSKPMEDAKISDFEEGNLSEETDRGGRVSRAQLLTEFRRLAGDLGRCPSKRELEQRAAYSYWTYRTRFGGLEATRDGAGLDPEEFHLKGQAATLSPPYTDDELLDDLRNLKKELGRPPRVQDLKNRDSGPSHKTFADRFGSHLQALAKAGIEPERGQFNDPERNYRTGTVLDTLVEMAIDLGYPPHETDGNADDRCSVRGCKVLFGSWGEALSAAGLPRRYRGGLYKPPTESTREYGHYWDSIRRRVLDRDRWRCQDCGMSNTDHKSQFDTGLHVHHIVPKEQFDSPDEANFSENLISLCQGCHRKWEHLAPSFEEIFGEETP